MAHLEIMVEDSLKERAQIVASSLGLDLPAAIRIFLRQMVKENGFPFTPGEDPFYASTNQEALRMSLEKLHQGKTITKSLEELRSME